MDEVYLNALRKYRLDPTKQNLKEVYWIYRRLNPNLKIEATFFPQRTYLEGGSAFYDDMTDPLWGSRYNITNKILEMDREDILKIEDHDYTSDSFIPEDILDDHYPHPHTVMVTESIQLFFDELLGIELKY